MRFLSKFFKRWYLYMLPLILIPAVVTIYGKNTLSIYESSALISVNTSTDGSSNLGSIYNTPAQNGADAMSQALQSEAFCVTVAQGTDLASRYDLSVPANQDVVTGIVQTELTVTPTAVGQNFVTITADDKNPLLAQQLVASFITQFEKYYANNQAAFLQQQINLLKGQIQTAQAQVNQDAAALSQYYQQNPQCKGNSECAATDPKLANLIEAQTQDQATVNTLASKLTTLQQQEDGLTLGGAGLFSVQDAPRLPLRTTLHLKKLIIYPIIGLAAALALIALIVGIQTVADRRVYTTRDLKTMVEDMDLNIPAIESVPVLRGIGRPSSQDEDVDGSLNGILVPVLTVLPQLGNGQMTQELRRAIGVTTVEDEE